MTAEWQNSKAILRSVGQKRKTSKTAKMDEMLYLFLGLSGTIAQQFSCYFTCTSVADSEHHIKNVNRNLEWQQNDNIRRLVCKTSIKKENLKNSKNRRNAMFLWIACRSIVCVFVHCFNVLPHIFAIMNFSVLLVSAVFCYGLLTWSAENLCKLQWHFVQQRVRTVHAA